MLFSGGTAVLELFLISSHDVIHPLYNSVVLLT